MTAVPPTTAVTIARNIRMSANAVQTMTVSIAVNAEKATSSATANALPPHRILLFAEPKAAAQVRIRMMKTIRARIVTRAAEIVLQAIVPVPPTKSGAFPRAAKYRNAFPRTKIRHAVLI